MKIAQQPTVSLNVTIQLNEAEARALDGLVGYGVDGFIDLFYKNLGDHYLKPHEAGLRSLFEDLRQTLPSMLSRADEARKAFNPPPKK